MSQDEHRRANDEEQDEVEGHHHRFKLANDEGAKPEDEGDDDFEAHGHHFKNQTGKL
jgi:hypothetical protein